MSGEHQPKTDFVDQLEWQLRTSLRREARFSSPVHGKRREKMNMIALLVVSAFFGAGAVVATDEVQESRAQEVLLTRIEGQMKIAAVQLEMAKANFQTIKERVDQGLVHEDALLDAEVTMRHGEINIARLRLDEEEIRRSGRKPQNDISAPLVDGQDYVSARLKLEISILQAQMDVVEQRLSRIHSRVEAGLLHTNEESPARMNLGQLQGEVDRIARRLALRQRFIEGDISATEAESEADLMEIRTQLQGQMRAQDQLLQSMDMVAQRVGQGLESESELDQLRLQLLQIQLEVETLRKTMEILGGAGDGGRM